MARTDLEAERAAVGADVTQVATQHCAGLGVVLVQAASDACLDQLPRLHVDRDQLVTDPAEHPLDEHATPSCPTATLSGRRPRPANLGPQPQTIHVRVPCWVGRSGRFRLLRLPQPAV